MADYLRSNFMILFDTAISPDKKWLIACSTFGDIFIWNIKSALNNNNRDKHNNNNNMIIDDNNYDYQYDDEDETDDNDYDLHETKKDDDEMNNNDNEENDKNKNKASFAFRVFDKDTLKPIYRLSMINNLLFVGTFQSLYIFKWDDIINQISKSKCNQDQQYNEKKTIYLNNIEAIYKFAPQIEYKFGAKSQYVEINAICNNSINNSVFLGSGHSSIFQFNYDKLKLMNTLNGHKDYVLDLSMNTNNLLTSASNDGTAKIWDIKNNNNKQIVSFDNNHNNNNNAQFANCCDLHENGRYVVVGYGNKNIIKSNDNNSSNNNNKICLYSLSMNKKFDEMKINNNDNNNNVIAQNVKFSNIWKPSSQSNLSIIAGYNNSNLFIFDKNYSNNNNGCSSLTKLKTSSSSIWSIRFMQASYSKIAVISGTSNCIDLFSNTPNIITSLTV